MIGLLDLVVVMIFVHLLDIFDLGEIAILLYSINTQFTSGTYFKNGGLY